MSDADDLYTVHHPNYFEIQGRDLWYYERLWAVLLRQLERQRGDGWLVEFGSGPGFLCAQANRRGWESIGVEPSAVARQHSVEMLGVTTCTTVGSIGADCAIATEVLEHVDAPRETLWEWRQALAPGSLLALSVPNDGNPLQRLFGRWISPDRKTPKWWIHPTHKSYFNPSSLKALVESCGFRVVWQRTSFPVELLLAVPFLPRHLAWKLSRLWPAPPFLWRFGIGRHCLLVARKV